MRPSARNKLMDLLARRDHSEKELRTKLRQRDFTDEEIDKAISHARDHGWLSSPAELAERYADSLHRKNKGIHYINQHLQNKGLPTLSRDVDLELEKAIRLVETKQAPLSRLSREEKAKAARFLISRGFDSETITRALFS